MGIIRGVDHLFTGKVERVDVELLQSLLAQGVIPVIPPLGFDGDGKTYRVNSDGVALWRGRCAQGGETHFHHHSGRLYCQGKLIRQMIVGELTALLKRTSASLPPQRFPGAARRRRLSRRRATRSRHQRQRWMKVCSPKYFPTKASARSSTPTSINKSGWPRRTSRHPGCSPRKASKSDELVRSAPAR